MLEPLEKAGIVALMTIQNIRAGFDYSEMSENVEDRDNQQERPLRLSRLAALLEAEGHLTIGMAPPSVTRNRMSLYPTIGFTNCDPKLVAEFSAMIEENGVGFCLRMSASRGAGSKKRYDLSIHGYDRVLKMLDLVQRYLHTKTEQAKILREFVAIRTASPRSEYGEREWELCTQIRLLNGRKPNVKSLAKVKARMESPESIRQPRGRLYAERYVKMCSDLQRELERTPEMSVPPILQRWVKK